MQTVYGKKCLYCLKQIVPTRKNSNTLLTKFLQRLQGLLEGFLNLRMRLAVEFIGIADQLLFQRLGHEVLHGQGQTALLYLSGRESRACMTLCYSCMALKSLLSKYLCTKPSMADVLLHTMTKYAISICLENPDVMQHGSFVDKLEVKPPLRMLTSDGQGTTGHLAGMTNEQILQLGL